MNIHEYQAKEILKKYGVKIGEGIYAETPEAAVEAAKKITGIDRNSCLGSKSSNTCWWSRKGKNSWYRAPWCYAC